MQLADREGSPDELRLEAAVKSRLDLLACYGYDLSFVGLSDRPVSRGTYYLPGTTCPHPSDKTERG